MPNDYKARYETLAIVAEKMQAKIGKLQGQIITLIQEAQRSEKVAAQANLNMQNAINGFNETNQQNAQEIARLRALVEELGGNANID